MDSGILTSTGVVRVLILSLFPYIRTLVYENVLICTDKGTQSSLFSTLGDILIFSLLNNCKSKTSWGPVDCIKKYHHVNPLKGVGLD